MKPIPYELTHARLHDFMYLRQIMLGKEFTVEQIHNEYASAYNTWISWQEENNNVTLIGHREFISWVHLLTQSEWEEICFKKYIWRL